MKVDPADSTNRFSWLSWFSSSKNQYSNRVNSCFQRSVSKDTETPAEPPSFKTKLAFPTFSGILQAITSVFFRTIPSSKIPETKPGEASEACSFITFSNNNDKSPETFYTEEDPQSKRLAAPSGQKKTTETNSIAPFFPPIADEYFEIDPNDLSTTPTTSLTETMQTSPPWIKNLIKATIDQISNENGNKPKDTKDEVSFNKKTQTWDIKITIDNNIEARIEKLPDQVPKKPIEVAVFFLQKNPPQAKIL